MRCACDGWACVWCRGAVCSPVCSRSGAYEVRLRECACVYSQPPSDFGFTLASFLFLQSNLYERANLKRGLEQAIIGQADYTSARNGGEDPVASKAQKAKEIEELLKNGAHQANRPLSPSHQRKGPSPHLVRKCLLPISPLHLTTTSHHCISALHPLCFESGRQRQ